MSKLHIIILGCLVAGKAKCVEYSLDSRYFSIPAPVAVGLFSDSAPRVDLFVKIAEVEAHQSLEDNQV